MHHVAALYHFTPIADTAALRETLRQEFAALPGLCGSLLIAPEGINGTLAVPDRPSIDTLLKILATHCNLTSHANVKFSTAPEKPFNRLKLRLKRETITFNQPHANPAERVGTYVPPADWNALVDDPSVTVLDTRNTYETAIGTFNRAVVPPITHFTEFAAWVRANLNPERDKKVAMFCTGGIRCEKASAFMLAEGFESVYHLQGGILKYLEDVPQENSRWQGDCYVFDKRMAVGHGLTTGHYSMCYACGAPLDDTARASDVYEAGVACPACAAHTTDADKARFRERQRGMESGG
jgi:UPF0176 protein